MPASATEREAAVRAAFADQARWCVKLGSPFTAMLCELVGERLDRSSELGRQILAWPGDARASGDALALRVAGGLHALVRKGEAPEVAALYPPRPMPQPNALWTALEPVTRGSELLPWLESPPQTNEVGRSAVLMSGLLYIAARWSQPFELLELGASAGLNLNLHHYSYRLGGLDFGDPASPVRLEPEWRDKPPPKAGVEVASRHGVDLNPLDPRTDGDRLLAYVWPDQRERLARMEGAIALAKNELPQVDSGDAAGWVEGRLAKPRKPGVTRVVLHSVAYQYFPPDVQARVTRAVEAAGLAARDDEPLAWLRYEKLPEEEKFSLRLRMWPAGEERQLAWCHPHGAWVEWLA